MFKDETDVPYCLRCKKPIKFTSRFENAHPDQYLRAEFCEECIEIFQEAIEKFGNRSHV